VIKLSGTVIHHKSNRSFYYYNRLSYLYEKSRVYGVSLSLVKEGAEN
jgi:hypothetical protein